jgi:hypothetical protein
MEWRTIPEFPNYEVNENGDVRSYRIGKNISPMMNRSGYYKLNIWHNGKLYSRLVHRLVAQAFISNPDDKPQINHIDSDKSNNHVSNLEWVTQKENMKHRTYNEVNTKRVSQYDIDGNFIREFKSLTEAANHVGAYKGNLSNVCLGRKKSIKGFIWRFSE